MFYCISVCLNQAYTIGKSGEDGGTSRIGSLGSSEQIYFKCAAHPFIFSFNRYSWSHNVRGKFTVHLLEINKADVIRCQEPETCHSSRKLGHWVSADNSSKEREMETPFRALNGRGRGHCKPACHGILCFQAIYFQIYDHKD